MQEQGKGDTRLNMNIKKNVQFGLFLSLCCISLASCRMPEDLPSAAFQKPEVVVVGESTDSDITSIYINEIGQKIDVYMEEFKNHCLNIEDEYEYEIKITTRSLMDISTEGGSITVYEDGNGRRYRYRLVLYWEKGQAERNYYLLDEFTYYTDVTQEYSAPLTYDSERNIARQISTEGIITSDGCYRYDREQNRILKTEPLDSVYSLNELEELYENGKNIPPESYGGYTDTEKAMDRYRQFLASDLMYSLTATLRYPRGDSKAVFGFLDCNEDGVPELYLEGGNICYIYTFRGDEILFLTKIYNYHLPSVIPLKNGAFVGNGWECSEIDGDLYSCRKIQPEDALWEDRTEQFDSNHTETGSYFEYYFRVDFQGTTDNVDPPVPYEQLLGDKSFHLPLTPLFPEEEWAYLDVAEEGDGSQNSIDDSEEWKAFERILSGDFTSIHNIEDRCHITSMYDHSLNDKTGRSDWKYMLLDLTGDEIRDLIVRYYPAEDDFSTINHPGIGIACFSYVNGSMIMWDFAVTHESFIPLKDGRVLYTSGYPGITSTKMTGQFDSGFSFHPDRIYERLTVVYNESSDRAWYEENVFGTERITVYTFCSQAYEIPKLEEEGVYYFTQDIEDGAAGELKPMSEDARKAWEDAINELMIPDEEWDSASVYIPNRYREMFSVG